MKLKRTVLLLLALSLCFSAVSCAPSLLPPTEDRIFTEEEEKETVAPLPETGPIVIPEGFSAGFAREALNPEPGTPLGGYSNAENRKSHIIRDDIMLTCVAVSDGENTLLLYSGDYLNFSVSIWNQVTRMIERSFGIPAANVLLNATHTHASPAIYYGSSLVGIARYLQEFYPLTVRLAENALRDLENAELYTGSTRTQGLNYVRRYLYMDGSYAGGSNLSFGQDPKLMRHETDPDETMQIIKFDRKTKKDIVLANWQCHPTAGSTSTSTAVTADWVSTFRETVEKKGDVLCSFHQGAAGTLVSYSKLSSNLVSERNCYKRGVEIGEVLLAALPSLKASESGKIRAITKDFTATYNEAYRTKNNLTATT